MKSRQLVFLIMMLLAVSFSAAAESAPVTRAYGDQYGAVHIIRSDGKETIIPKQRGTDGVEQVKLAKDGQTVGWIVDWPYFKGDEKLGSLPDALVIWRGGKVVRRLGTEQVFYFWMFWKDGEQVAFHDGPLHGLDPNYELHDVATGRLIQQFLAYDNNGDPAKVPDPDWVEALNQVGYEK